MYTVTKNNMGLSVCKMHTKDKIYKMSEESDITNPLGLKLCT